MEIGEPKRILIVEPIQLPEPLRRTESPAPPERKPVETPVEEPVPA